MPFCPGKIVLSDGDDSLDPVICGPPAMGQAVGEDRLETGWNGWAILDQPIRQGLPIESVKGIERVAVGGLHDLVELVDQGGLTVDQESLEGDGSREIAGSYKQEGRLGRFLFFTLVEQVARKENEGHQGNGECHDGSPRSRGNLHLLGPASGRGGG